MKWIETLTGNYSPSARVVDGTLIISLPQAITPVVWRMELGHARSSALEVRKTENGHFVLTLKTPKGDVYDIAPFDQRGRAVEALMAVSRAMEQAHGQTRPVAANGTGVTNLPAVRAEKRPASRNRVITGLVGTGLLFLLVAVLMNTGNPNTDGHVTIPGATSASITPAAGQPAGNAPQTGVPLSADDFLNNR